MVTERVPFGELNQSQRNIAYREVNEKRREYPSRRFFVFPCVSCSLRHATPCGRCLCFATVPFGVWKGPSQLARFGSKLSESLVAEGRRVNRPFPFGVVVFRFGGGDPRRREHNPECLSIHGYGMVSQKLV